MEISTVNRHEKQILQNDNDYFYITSLAQDSYERTCPMSKPLLPVLNQVCQGYVFTYVFMLTEGWGSPNPQSALYPILPYDPHFHLSFFYWQIQWGTILMQAHSRFKFLSNTLANNNFGTNLTNLKNICKQMYFHILLTLDTHWCPSLYV